MRIVFMGTSDFAVPPLRALAASRHEVSLAVPQPDRPAGRGRQSHAPPVKKTAEAAGLAVFQPEKVNTRVARAVIRDADPEVIVVVSFGQILRPLLLALPPAGCLNIHASLLPRHRGASPIHAAVLAGDAESGVTIMRMDEGLDTGPMALVRATPLAPDETAGTLHDRLAEMGAEMIVEALDRLEEGTLVFNEQPAEGATHAGMLSKKDGVLDFSLGAPDLERRVRGLTPWPGAWCDLRTGETSRRLIVEEAESLPGESGAPGCIVAVEKDAFIVACGEGALRVRRVKPAGKRSMSVREFLNGTPVAVDDRMESTP